MFFASEKQGYFSGLVTNSIGHFFSAKVIWKLNTHLIIPKFSFIFGFVFIPTTNGIANEIYRFKTNQFKRKKHQMRGEMC